VCSGKGKGSLIDCASVYVDETRPIDRMRLENSGKIRKSSVSLRELSVYTRLERDSAAFLREIVIDDSITGALIVKRSDSPAARLE